MEGLRWLRVLLSSGVDTLFQDAGSYECSNTNEPPGVSGPPITQTDVPSYSISVVPMYSTDDMTFLEGSQPSYHTLQPMAPNENNMQWDHPWSMQISSPSTGHAEKKS